MIYLVSMPTLREARLWAERYGLTPADWRYIPPPTDPGRREFRLRGYSDTPPDHLIGDFSSEERACLYRPPAQRADG